MATQWVPVGAESSGRSQGGQGGHDPPNEIDSGLRAGHFALARSATKRKVVQTLAHCPVPSPSFDLTISNHVMVFLINI